MKHWRGAPERDDLVRVRAHGNAEGARQAKVGELQVAIAVDQKVLKECVRSITPRRVLRVLIALHGECRDESCGRDHRVRRGSVACMYSARAMHRRMRLYVRSRERAAHA